VKTFAYIILIVTVAMTSCVAFVSDHEAGAAQQLTVTE
jgi:hypothetical protein